jgi:hypothetical protein
MSGTVFNNDVHISGQLTFGSEGGVTLPKDSVTDTQVKAAAGIAANKTQIRQRKTYAQPSADTAAAETRVVHVAKATGQLESFVAGLVTKCADGSVVNFDLKKNGTSILTSAVQLTDAQENYETVSGVIDTLSYVAGDVFEVTVTVDAGTGTLGKGAFAQAVFDENAA